MKIAVRDGLVMVLIVLLTALIAWQAMVLSEISSEYHPKDRYDWKIKSMVGEVKGQQLQAYCIHITEDGDHVDFSCPILQPVAKAPGQAPAQTIAPQ